MRLFKKKQRDDNAFLRDIYQNAEESMSSWLSTLFASRFHELHHIEYELSAANQNLSLDDDNTIESAVGLVVSTMMTDRGKTQVKPEIELQPKPKPKSPVLEAWHGPSNTVLNITLEATLPAPKTVSITHGLYAYEPAENLLESDNAAGLRPENNILIAEFPKLVDVFVDPYSLSPECGQISANNATNRLHRVLASMTGDEKALEYASRLLA